MVLLLAPYLAWSLHEGIRVISICPRYKYVTQHFFIFLQREGEEALLYGFLFVKPLWKGVPLKSSLPYQGLYINTPCRLYSTVPCYPSIGTSVIIHLGKTYTHFRSFFHVTTTATTIRQL